MKPSHRERLTACLQGQILDRPPIALWRHFPVDDQSPETLAAAALHFQNAYDFDLVKVTPASSFCLKDWGVDDKWTGNPEGTRDYTKRVIMDPGDWERLPELNPTSEHLAAQLTCLRLIRAKLDPETPILQTVFSPLAQAKNLAGNAALLAHLRLHPNAVMKGLQTIATSTRRFVEAAREIGMDGIFYAVQHAQASLLSLDEYKIFGLPNDLKVIDAAKDLPFNLLHLHGRDVYFSLTSSFGFPMVNWHDRETPPNLESARKEFAGVVCGGLRQETLVFGDQVEVGKEAAEAIQQTQGKRFILGTGCVVPVMASHGNLMAARNSVEDARSG